MESEQMEFRAGLDSAHGGTLLTPDEIAERDMIDYLRFCSYRENRRLSPEVTPEEWGAIYGPKVGAMEARYQMLCGCAAQPDLG